MIFLPDDLGKLTAVRLNILFGQLLVAIKKEIAATPSLKRLCAQSDQIEDEIARREFSRDEASAP